MAGPLFEAAACGVPIISDPWPGLETIFEPDSEILVSRRPEDTLGYLRKLTQRERTAIGRRALRRVLSEHTAAHRAAELEGYVRALAGSAIRTRVSTPSLSKRRAASRTPV